MSNRNIHHNVMAALDEVADTITWWGTDIGQQYGKWFIRQVNESSPLQIQDPDHFTKGEVYRLSHSPMYWVERDMVDLLLAAVQTFPSKRLWPEDLPSPSGIVYFEKPIYMPDRHGKMIGLKAFEWFTQPLLFRNAGAPMEAPMGALSLSFYNHRDDPKDDTNQALWEQARKQGRDPKKESGPLALYHYLPWSFGTYWSVDADGNYRMNLPMVTGNRPPTQEEWEELIQHMKEEREDQLPDGAEETPFKFKDQEGAGAGWYPLVDCLWTLLQQRITHIGAHQPDRHTGRRIKKVLPDPQIQIVTLRRPAAVYHGDVEESSRDVEWSRRWIVDGHWRWQWYPSEQKHRRIYITPFIKGPEDKPLVVKDKVYAWKR